MPQPHPWGWQLPIGIEGLDAQLCVRDADGRVLCCVVLLVTLYIEHGDTEDARKALVQAHERYVREAGDVMRWFANPDTGSPEPLTDPQYRSLRTWPAHLFQRYDLQVYFHGGARVEDADPRSFVAVSREIDEDELSVLSMTLPLTWTDAHAPTDLVAFVLDVCSLLRPVHGYAGLGVIPHVSGFDEDAERPLFDLARRFRGLDLDMPVEHAPLLQSRECIKGVNWLTVLSDAWAERASGAQAIHKTSGAGAVVHPFQGGVVLQAGTIPRFGDVASAEPMPFYDRAAAALKDIRCDDPALMATNDGIGFDMAEAADWLHRFG